MPPTLTADPTTVNVNAQIPPQPGLESDPQTAQIPQPEASASPGTQPTSTPGTNLVGQNPDAYNPLAAQPYTPPEAVPVTPLPQTQLGPDQPPNGAVSHAGGVAYGLDQVLRGFMRGRAQNQAAQAINLAKTSSGLQKNLDMASQQYYALARAGTDPNSQQMQDAKSQVDAAWQANMEFMKQHIAGQQIDKKTGQIKPQGGGISGLMQRLVNGQDPAAQALAVYQGAQRLGPPVYHQAAPFQTPAYQAYARTQAQTAGLTNQNALATQQTTAQKAALQSELNTLNAKKPEDLTDADVARRDQLGDVLQQPTEAAAAKRQLLERVMAMPIPTEEPARSNALAQQARLVAQITGKGQGAFTPTARLAAAGSVGEQMDRIAAAHGITRAQLPPAVADAIIRQNAWDKKVPTSTTRTGTIDTIDPVTHQPTKTPIQFPGGTAPGPRPSLPPGWGDPLESALPPDVTHPSAVAAGAAAYTRTINSGYSPEQAKTVAKTAASAAQKSLVKLGTPIPTGKPRQQTPDETDAYKTEGNIGKQLTTAEQAAKLSNHAVGDTMLSTSLAHANVGGRLSNFDIQRFSNLGSARLRMEGDVLRTIDGTMTDEQRNMILDYLRVSYQSAHNLAEHYRNRDAGVGQISSKTSSPASGSPAAPSVDDLENLFQKAKAK